MKKERGKARIAQVTVTAAAISTVNAAMWRYGPALEKIVR
jgi:hypothetical protein